MVAGDYLTVAAGSQKAAAADSPTVAEGNQRAAVAGSPMAVARDSRRPGAAAAAVEDSPGSHLGIVVVAAVVAAGIQSHLDTIHPMVPSREEALAMHCLPSPDKAVAPSSRR